jgi:cell division protein FtsQ
MWDNVATLRRTSNFILLLAGALMLYGAGNYAIHREILPLRYVRVTGNISHVTREQVTAVVSQEIRGNFFTVDLANARQAFEKLPWVRTVNVRRQWPDQLAFEVEEHKPIARWGSIALVSAEGDVFEAAVNSTLPVLEGPDGTAPEIVSRLRVFDKMLEASGRHVARIILSARRTWVLQLDDGMVLELGRENIESRLAGFVSAYSHTVALLPIPTTYVDLRYANGFAVRATGIKLNRKKS